MTGSTLGRRRFLQSLGGAAVAAAGAPLLSACGSDSNGDDDDEIPEAGVFDIPDTGTELPENDVTVRVLATPDGFPEFWEKFGAAYKEVHSNISLEFEGFPNPRIQEVLPLAIRNGDAHDIFTVPGQIGAPNAVREGWVEPLDDVIPDFEEWKAAFPPGSFAPGINIFDGKTYSFPVQSTKWYVALVLFNNS